MKIRTALVFIVALIASIPWSATAKTRKVAQRGMLENMDAVPCGAKQHGVAGLGAVWASVGVTHVNSDEKLCPQYLFRTDQMDYQIRPTDLKNPALLQVGQEAEYKIKNNRMFLTVNDKTRTYEVVGMKPANSDSAQSGSADKP